MPTQILKASYDYGVKIGEKLRLGWQIISAYLCPTDTLNYMVKPHRYKHICYTNISNICIFIFVGLLFVSDKGQIRTPPYMSFVVRVWDNRGNNFRVYKLLVV